MIVVLSLALAAQQVLTVQDTLEFPEAMRPAFDGYMECLSTGLTMRAKSAETLPVDFYTAAESVIEMCKPTRARAFVLAQKALAPDPVPPPDHHATTINKAFAGVEASFRSFVQTLRAAAEQDWSKAAK